MKKTLVALMALGLAASLMGAPAVAKKKAKPVATTLYFHGTQQAGEAQMDETWLNNNWMTMDATEPAAGAPKSMFVTNYMRGPNTDCNGNGLLPVWRGNLAGTVKGDVKLTLNTVATPAVQLVASLYPDATGQCASDGSNPALPAAEAPQPVAQETVDVAPGPGVTEIVFKGVNFKSAANMIVQLHVPNLSTPGQVRVLYDSADYATNVSFLCAPAAGKTCTG
jgi:hypothetical protein